MPLKAGESIIIDSVQYEVKKLLGRGGLSAVFLAQDYKTNEKVAIKEFLYQKFFDPISRKNDCEEYWENEVLNTIAQSKSGKAAVKVIHYEKKGNIQTPEYYIVLNFIEGMTFLNFYREFVQLCRGLKHLDISSIVRNIFIPLAEHLDYCHRVENIVHRDFSVENILIQKDDEGNFWPILIDWGVSKYVGPEWIYYTPKPYMTPDMARDVPITQKGAPPEIRFGYMPNATSDIYYLAHLMYFVFTGGIMREDSELENVESWILNPKKVNWFVPEKFDEVVQKMTAFEPADRPHTMKEVIHMLHELITIQQVHFDFSLFLEPDTDELTGERLPKKECEKKSVDKEKLNTFSEERTK